MRQDRVTKRMLFQSKNKLSADFKVLPLEKRSKPLRNNK
jgi:hypothetical protein